MRAKGLAHRGYPAKHPENTLVAYRAACDLGFEYVELDVQLSKDGIPVVIHDLTVNRTTNGTGYVKDMTLHELKQLRIEETEEIPTLEEALRLMKGQTIVDIELKQFGDTYPGLEEKVLDLVKKLDMQDQTVITSFDHYAMIRTRQLDADIPIGLINHGSSPALIQLLKELNGRYVSVKYEYLTEAFVRLCEEERIELIAYTINDEATMRRIADWPVLVCTNELERWLAVTRH